MISQRRAHELQPDPATVGTGNVRVPYLTALNRAKTYSAPGGADDAVQKRLARILGQQAALQKMKGMIA